MMRRWGLWLIALILCGLIAAAFVWPRQMVAPGPLIPAHAHLAKDCFACHAPLRGASAERCIACHKITDIGVRTTKGVALDPGNRRVAFHQFLSQPDCMACHSDHSGPALVKTQRQSFAHELLRPAVRGQCATCHMAPATALHAKAGSNCAQCHTQKGWKPATFDHARLFALTGPHNASCVTCHIGGNFNRYTCFACHEHQPDQIRARHAREGITNIENCARCHRSGSGEGEGGERGGNGRDND
jgi:hypothetical protein